MSQNHTTTQKDISIGSRVFACIKSVHGLSKTAIAKEIGMDTAQFYRLIDGKHRWTIIILDEVIDALRRHGVEVSRNELLGEGVRIPVVAEVSAGMAFPWTDGGFPAGNGFDYIYARDVPGISDDLASKCYAVRVRGDSMLPLLKSGDLLIIKPASREEVVNGDNVVFKDRDYNAYIKWVELKGDLLTLNSFNPIFKPLHFKPSDIVFMDKVIIIIKS